MQLILMPRRVAWWWAAFSLLGTGLAQQSSPAQIIPQSAPHDGYFAAFVPFLDGDFRTAGKAFSDAGRDGIMNISLTTPGPWVDAICYHAMLGECHYQMGELQPALDEFSTALRFTLAHRDWMLRIDFPPVVEPETTPKMPPPWGASSRATLLGHYKPRYSSLIGRLDNQNAVRQGGVVAPPSFIPVYAGEIVRCTALAISRRRELLGPLSEHDALTVQVVEALGRFPAPQNHWSQCWVQLQLGLAYAAANRLPQAVSELQKSLQAMGQYDHPLTCVALLELGRIAFEQGKYDAAKTYFHEASISAHYFERRDVMEEAFRLGAEAHLLAGSKGAYPPLNPAIASLSRVRMLSASLLIALAEQLISAGELAPATSVIAQARNTIGRREMASGAIGSRLNYQTARLAAHKEEWKASTTALAVAMTYQKAASLRLFHLAAADFAYRSGSLTERIADLVFSQTLREPAHTDWQQAPLDTLALISSYQPAPYEHWFDLALSRREFEKAVNIAERTRRRRFLATQPYGGRLLGLRWVFEGPSEDLSQEATLERQTLLAKYPHYADLSHRSAELVSKLRDLPLAPTEATQVKSQHELLTELARTSNQQEAVLQMIALEREPCELAFPPLRDTKAIQEKLPPGAAALYYVAASRGLHTFAIARDRYSQVQVVQPAKVKTDIVELLRQLGNYDRSQAVSADDLRSKNWQSTAKRLVNQLAGQSQSSDWTQYRELIIIPDGPLWYLPFEALPMPGASDDSPLVMLLPIRYAPLLSLAVTDRKPRRLERTAVIAGKLISRDDTQANAAAQDIAPRGDAAVFGRDFPQPSSIFSATFDRLVVLADHDDTDKAPAGWAPMFFDSGRPGSTLADWMQLPLSGVEQAVFPGFHTAAENSLKRTSTGDEIFLTATSLMATGCRTALLSRWRIGGQSTVDLLREFVQELPHQPASAAWRRSVQLASERMLDPALEPRIRPGSSDGIPSGHPFFWSGYMLLDTGATPIEAAEHN